MKTLQEASAIALRQSPKLSGSAHLEWMLRGYHLGTQRDSDSEQPPLEDEEAYIPLQLPVELALLPSQGNQYFNLKP